MNEFVNSQRAAGPQIRAQDLYDTSWRYSDTRTDPRLDEPCLIYDLLTSTWWEDPGEGHDGREDEAGQWTPRMWFEDGYGGETRERNVFCLISPVEVGNYPKAWRVFDDVTAARLFLKDYQSLKFLSRGANNGRYALRGYLDGVGPSATHVRNHAGLFDAAEINNVKFDAGLAFEILPADYVPPPKPKITIKNILTPKMIENLQVMPDNPIIRTQVWSLIKAPIPEDKKTFEEIKTWIEENYDPKFVGSFKEPPLDDLESMLGGVTLPELRDSGFDIDVNTQRDVRGHCRYSATEVGHGNYPVTAAMIVEAARLAQKEEERPLNHFRNFLSQRIIDRVIDDPPEDTEERDVETHDHDSTDGGELRINYHPRAYDEALRWLWRYHPDLAEALDPGGMEDDDPN